MAATQHPRFSEDDLLTEIYGAGSVAPPSGLKQNILGRLGFADEELDLNNLPPTSKYSNHLSWLKVLESVLPSELVGQLFMQEIRHDEDYVQSLVVSRVNVPEEVHEEYPESFFILEGRCACTVGTEVFELAAGDFLDIPLLVPHDVKLLTAEVKAIVQYRLS